MIAVARSISYGQAYSEYAEQKDKAVFIGADNMISNKELIFKNKDHIEDLWQEFEEAGLDYARKGKDISRDTIVIEFSPTKSESEEWTSEQWFEKARELLEVMDQQQLEHPKWDPKKKDWERDSSGKKKMYPIPQTKLSRSKWMAMLHKDSASGIWHLHIIISRFNMDNELNCDTDIAKRAAKAAEELNKKYGFPRAMDIRAEHLEQLNTLLNDILFDMDGEEINFEEFERKVKEATFVDYKGNIQHYDFQFRRDDNGEIVGYSIGRGNSIFTGKELGFRLTNIEETQKKIIKDAIYDTLRRMDDPLFDWQKFVSIMDTDHQCDIQVKKDSNGDIINYSITRGKKTYNSSQIGAHVTAKKIEDEWKKVQEKQGNKVKVQKPEVATKNTNFRKNPTEGFKERQKAISDARDTIKKWAHSGYGVITQSFNEVIGNGAAAMSIERGDSPFINVNLEGAAQELVQDIELSARQLSIVMITAASALIDMAMPHDLPSGGGGGAQDTGGWSDDKDDWWDKWKNAFKNNLTISKSGGRKR